MARVQSQVEMHRPYKESYWTHSLWASSVPQSQQAHRAESILHILKFSCMTWAVAVMVSSLIFHGLFHMEINFYISIQKKNQCCCASDTVLQSPPLCFANLFVLSSRVLLTHWILSSLIGPNGSLSFKSLFQRDKMQPFFPFLCWSGVPHPQSAAYGTNSGTGHC